MGHDNNANYTFQIKNEDGNCETISLGEIQEINIEKWSEDTTELKDPTAEMKTAEITFVLPKKHRRKAKRIIKKQRKLLKKLGELESKWLSLFITFNDIKSKEKKKDK